MTGEVVSILCLLHSEHTLATLTSLEKASQDHQCDDQSNGKGACDLRISKVGCEIKLGEEGQRPVSLAHDLGTGKEDGKGEYCTAEESYLSWYHGQEEGDEGILFLVGRMERKGRKRSVLASRCLLDKRGRRLDLAGREKSICPTPTKRIIIIIIIDSAYLI